MVISLEARDDAMALIGWLGEPSSPFDEAAWRSDIETTLEIDPRSDRANAIVAFLAERANEEK